MLLIFHLGQFLDDTEYHIWTQEQWLLAYASVLQCMAEANDGCCWLNRLPQPSFQLVVVIEAFMEEMGLTTPRLWLQTAGECPQSHSPANMRDRNGPVSQSSSMSWFAGDPVRVPLMSWLTSTISSGGR